MQLTLKTQADVHVQTLLHHGAICSSGRGFFSSVVTSVATRLMAVGLVCCCLVTKSCPTLCDPMDGSPPGSSVHGILQARMLEWVAMPSSRGSSRPRDGTHIWWIRYH